MSTGEVQCHNCDILLWRPTEAEAIAAWNRRDTPQPEAQQPEPNPSDVGWACYNEQALADYNIDFLEERADVWMEDSGVQRMFNAVASVFEKYAPQEIMDRFREQLGIIGRQCHVEGALRAWEEIAAQQRTLGHPLPVDHAALKARTSNETVELLRECRPHIARIAGMEQAGGYPLIATSTLHRIDAYLSNITDQRSDQHD
jgi:hypothetical protein